MAQDISPSGIASAEAFGTAEINYISPTAIASSEAFGAATIINAQVITFAGITSGETFGLAAINYISPTGLDSAEAFGAATVLLAQDIAPTAIAGAEAFGALTVANVIPTAASGKGKVNTTLFGDVAFLPIEATVPCTETLEWKTDVRITHDGSEGRDKIRTAPRQALKYRYPEGISNKDLAYLTEYGGYGETWAVPLWIESQALGALASGQSSITLTTTDYDYRNSSLALLYESPTNYEIIEINQVSLGSMTLLVNTANTYTNVNVMPVRRGVIDGPVSKANRGHTAITSIKYKMLDNLALYEDAPLDQFLGDDVYMDPPLVKDAAQGYQQEVMARTDKADFDTGLFSQLHPWLSSRTLRPAMALHQGAPAIRLFKMFLERRSGKHRQYWEPSFESDLKITGTGVIGTTLRVAQIGQEDWNASRNHIAVEDVAGNWHFRTISAFTAVGNDVDLTIENLSLEAEGVRTICFLGLKRLATDNIEIKWVGNNVITSTINTVEIAP